MGCGEGLWGGGYGRQALGMTAGDGEQNMRWTVAVFPTAQSVLLGALGRTTPGKVRTGRTIGDYIDLL